MAWERPAHWAPPFPSADAKWLVEELKRLGAKRVLEFGPGDSTQVMAELGIEIVSCEHDQKWFEQAKVRFKDVPNVTILKFENEMPVPPIEGLSGEFDIAFVDTPQGYALARKVFPGYEDCSRYNTCLFAVEHCPTVLLHDATRPLERGTLGRLNRLGYKHKIVGSFAWLHGQTSSTALSATSAPSRKGKRRTRTPTRRSVTSSTACSPNSKQGMSSTSKTSTPTT